MWSPAVQRRDPAFVTVLVVVEIEEVTVAALAAIIVVAAIPVTIVVIPAIPVTVIPARVAAIVVIVAPGLVPAVVVAGIASVTVTVTVTVPIAIAIIVVASAVIVAAVVRTPVVIAAIVVIVVAEEPAEHAAQAALLGAGVPLVFPVTVKDIEQIVHESLVLSGGRAAGKHNTLAASLCRMSQGLTSQVVNLRLEPVW